eukprot:138311-Chlamydomonas_euryale.AAC.5
MSTRPHRPGLSHKRQAQAAPGHRTWARRAGSGERRSQAPRVFAALLPRVLKCRHTGHTCLPIAQKGRIPRRQRQARCH